MNSLYNVSIVIHEDKLYYSLNDMKKHYWDLLMTIKERYKNSSQTIPMIKSDSDTYILGEKLDSLVQPTENGS